jgi:hypothetical protein
MSKGQHRCLKTEQHGGIIAHRLIVDLTRLTVVLTELLELRLVSLIWQCITTEVRQRGTLADACPIAVRQMDQPDLPLRI